MKKIYIFCFLLFGIGIISGAMPNQKNTEVSFYLTNMTDTDILIHKKDFSGAVLNKSPVFTTKDIIEYSQSEHSIKLTKEAYNKYKVIKTGTVFAFCVYNKPVYFGVVWAGYWSQPLNCVVAIGGNNKIEISLGFPNESFFEGIDPRSNKLILDSLKKSNKLVE